MQMNRYCQSFLLSAVISPFFSLAQTIIPQGKPNVILIYADDLGYSDLGCYGREFGNNFTETPNIDRLARQGMRFTNAYASAPISSASRAGLLTGQYPARLGFEFVTTYERNAMSWESDIWKKKYEGKKLLPPPLKLNLPLEEPTIAEMLRNNGYETAIAGKWHVASHVDRYNDWNPYYGPKQRGFSWTADTYGAHPYSYAGKNENEISKDDFPVDELTNQSINFLKQKHEKPFFLFVSHHYVHTPVDVRAEKLIEKYRKKAAGSQTEERIMYAAFVEQFDHYVGQLLDAIDAAGLTENTLVIFSSDNGGDPAYSFNRPLRGSKWNLYEGGIRIPFLVRWPSYIQPGSTNDQPILQLDLMPTLYELYDIEDNYYEEKFDGLSILPYLKGQRRDKNTKRTFIWHFPYYHPEGDKYENALTEIGKEDGVISQTKPQSAIRKGDYKLIYFYENESAELYNLKTDPGEMIDLSKKEMKTKKNLETELLKNLKKMNARLPRKQ